MRRGYEVVPKAFSMGLRIEHLREDIDRSLYGDDAGHPLLPPAEYAMSRHYGERTAYTFCMCPGGEVVAASSEEGLLAVNGMSRYARDGRNSNSAVLVSIAASDTPDGQIELQRRYERAAFLAGGGRYRAPVQTVGDFMSGGVNALPSRVLPTYMGGGADKVTTADLSEVVSGVMGAEALDVLRCGIRDFARQISCFNTPRRAFDGGRESNIRAGANTARRHIYRDRCGQCLSVRRGCRLCGRNNECRRGRHPLRRGDNIAICAVRLSRSTATWQRTCIALRIGAVRSVNLGTADTGQQDNC